jgi:DNA adenine methylase
LPASFWGLSRPTGYIASPFWAAIFFAKEPAKVEIINDINGEIVNFYEVLKRDVTALEKEVAITLHSRNQHRQAQVIYENPDMFDRIKRAWAVWMLANSSYGCMLDGGYAYDRIGTNSKKLDNKRAGFTSDYAARLQRVQIECCDALRIIRSRDAEDAFFYLDPPYVGSDQGHYNEYTQEDFNTLLGVLEGLQGKFLLSSFRNEALAGFARRNGWYSQELKRTSSMTHGYKTQRKKIEVLTANYPIAVTPEAGGRKGGLQAV